MMSTLKTTLSFCILIALPCYSGQALAKKDSKEELEARLKTKMGACSAFLESLI